MRDLAAAGVHGSGAGHEQDQAEGSERHEAFGGTQQRWDDQGDRCVRLQPADGLYQSAGHLPAQPWPAATRPGLSLMSFITPDQGYDLVPGRDGRVFLVLDCVERPADRFGLRRPCRRRC